MSETSGIDAARLGPRRRVPEVVLVLATIAVAVVIMLGLVVEYGQMRGRALDTQARLLTEKHGVTFQPLESVGRRTNLRRWSIDGDVFVCETQSDALVCTDGTSFER